MIICGICLGMTTLVWITAKKRLSKEQKQILGVLMISATVGILYGIGNMGESVLKEGHYLERRENGEGSYEQTLELEIEGYEESLEYEVVVPEQHLSQPEQEEYLAAAVEEMQRDFPGENESVNCIRERVSIRDTYQNGKVSASWMFDEYKIVNYNGEVIAKELPEDGQLVRAAVVLSCEDTERTEEFYFRVFPIVRNEEEEIVWQIGQKLEGQESEAAKTYLELPGVIDGHQLNWKAETDRTPEKLLFFGIVLASFLPLLKQSRQREEEKKRVRLLELEYPDMVSKIALLLGAGMTLQGAIRKLALNYSEKKEQHLVEEQPAYEELLVICREIENGMGEGAAYERLGNRCERAEYRKLGNLLAQNLRKGSNGIMALLEEEAERAFEERKGVARRYGEEAGTKLLFPMLLMLGLVMVVLLVPAVLAFQL